MNRNASKDKPLINEKIRAKEVRLIDENGTNHGIVSTSQALRMAEEADLDLVVISPNQAPPVAKILNYGKYKYTIIYEMQYQNNVIFNIMEEYSVLGHNNKIVFISFFSSMLLYVVFLCFYKGKEEDNTISDFEILRPNWEKIFFIGNIFGGIGFITKLSLILLPSKILPLNVPLEVLGLPKKSV